MTARQEVRRAAYKLVIATVVSVAVFVTIAATLRPIGQDQPTRTYTADFTSASRIQPGDEVRVAGVPAGRVRSVELTPTATARIHLDVEDDLALSTATRVEIRYLNLVGDRYVALVDDGSSQTPQPVDRPIGADRTQPALDLNTLLGGFKPLFAALSAEDINNLSLDIVQTLQGDGATVQSLIARTASLTTGLAERDELIGSVISNLDQTVGLVAGRHAQLETLIGQLRRYVGGLSDDREVIGEAIEHIDSMAQVSQELLADTRPSIKADLAHLREIATTLNEPENTRLVEHTLDHVPDKLDRLVRTASYGSYFNYYLCGLTLKVGTGVPALQGIDKILADLLGNVHLVDTSKRCAG